MDKKEYTTKAKIENVRDILSFIEGELLSKGCDELLAEKIEMAVEEMVVNVAEYAYSDGEGDVTIYIGFVDDNVVQIEIVDKGVSYDPTLKPDPDVSRPFKERKKGGLGIFMAKKMMDEMKYEYKDGMNRITMRKKL